MVSEKIFVCFFCFVQTGGYFVNFDDFLSILKLLYEKYTIICKNKEVATYDFETTISSIHKKLYNTINAAKMNELHAIPHFLDDIKSFNRMMYINSSMKQMEKDNYPK